MCLVKKIEACIAKLSTEIESNYSDCVNLEGISIDSNKITSFNTCLSKFVKDVYSALNFSTITGEYVENSEIENSLSTLRSDMENLITLIPATLFEIGDSLMRNLKLIIRDLRLYRFEIHLFRKSIDNPAYRYIDYDIVNEENVDIKDSITSIEIYSEIFLRNLRLMSIDRELILSRKVLYELIIIYGRLLELKKKRDENYIDILLSKTNLLLSKFNYLNNVDDLRQVYNYYEDKEVEVPLKSESFLKDSSLNEKLKKIYTKDKSDYVYNISKYYDKVKNLEISTWTTFIKCHYFKNVVKSEYLLNNLIDEFKVYRNKLESAFDKRNASYCLNYLYNCKLSLKLSSQDMDSLSIWDEMMQIRNIQDSTEIHNYFPYLKIAEWYNNFLSKEIQTIDDSSKIKTLVNQFERCVEYIEDYLKESRNNASCFIPYKPVLSECFDKYDIDGEKISVFISTSYIVPVDYEREYKTLQKLRSSLMEFKAIVGIQTSIYSVISDLKNKNNSIQKHIDNLRQYVDNRISDFQLENQNELKDNQKNNVQILAIFAGIVIFVSSSIQIFQGVESFKEACIFMMLFAASMSLFAVLIFAIFTKNKFIIKILVVTLAIIIATYMFAVFCWNGSGVKVFLIDLF